MANEARSAPYKVTDYLETPDAIQEYLNAALEDGDERVLLRALRNVVDKMGGISHLASRTGLARESLYRTLSEESNPRFSSLIAILKAMGLKLAVRPRWDAARLILLCQISAPVIMGCRHPGWDARIQSPWRAIRQQPHTSAVPFMATGLHPRLRKR